MNEMLHPAFASLDELQTLFLYVQRIRARGYVLVANTPFLIDRNNRPLQPGSDLLFFSTQKAESFPTHEEGEWGTLHEVGEELARIATLVAGGRLQAVEVQNLSLSALLLTEYLQVQMKLNLLIQEPEEPPDTEAAVNDNRMFN